MRFNKKCGFLTFILLLISSTSFAANQGDSCPAGEVNRIYQSETKTQAALICDGSVLQYFESAKANPIKKGIATNSPEATLHVDGEVIIGNTSLGCSATTEGAIRYNSTDKGIEICNGTAWGAIRASACDNSPAFFHFDDQTNLATSTLATSNIVLITGMDAACTATISVSGTGGSPEYRTCSNSNCSTEVQTWTTANNTLDVQGDYMQLRATSSANLATAFTITANVGGVTSDWVISTGMSGCSPEGAVCSDGSVYAGLSGAATPMYVTRCDAGMTWSGAACTGTRSLMHWNNGNTSGYVDTTLVNNNASDGQTYTATLITEDSDSDVGGMQLHIAAQYCADLVLHSHSDWYLPAKNELNTIYGNKAAIANFITDGTYYLSSSEYSSNFVVVQSFDNGSQPFKFKNDTFAVRCARR